MTNGTKSFFEDEEVKPNTPPPAPALENRVGPEGFKTIYVVLIVILVQIAAGLFSFGSTLALIAGISAFSFAYIYVLLKKTGWKSVFGMFNFKETSLKEFFWLFVGTLVFTVFFRLLIFALASFLGPGFLSFITNSPTQELLCSQASCNIFLQVNVILLLPFAEEIIFRGFILRRQVFKFGLLKGLIYSSLIFGLFHTPDILAIFSLAFVLGFLYIKYKNIYVPFAFHALHNASVSLFMFFSKGDPSAQLTEEVVSGIQSSLWFYLLVVLVLGYFIVRHMRKNWDKLKHAWA